MESFHIITVKTKTYLRSDVCMNLILVKINAQLLDIIKYHIKMFE